MSEKEFDYEYEIGVEDFPIVVNQDGVRTLLKITFDIDGKIKAYLESSGLLDRLEDLEKKVDELEGKVKELEENGGSGGANEEESENKVLADYSWEEIKEIADSGKASDIFNVGDTIDINTSEGARTLAIMHFNHPDFTYSNGKTCEIIFGTIHGGYSTAKRTDYIYNKDSTYNTLIENKINGFDSDLKSAISSINYTYKEGTGVTESTKQWSSYSGKIMAIPYEMLGQLAYQYHGSVCFDYYLENTSKKKNSQNGVGTSCDYWTSSGEYTGLTISGPTYVYESTGRAAYDIDYSLFCYDCFIFAV